MSARPGANPHSVAEHGITLTVQVTPRISRSKLNGGGVLPSRRRALGVSVAAPSVNGADDAALLTILNKLPAVRESKLVIVSGDASRLTVV